MTIQNVAKYGLYTALYNHFVYILYHMEIEKGSSTKHAFLMFLFQEYLKKSWVMNGKKQPKIRKDGRDGG